MIGKTRTLIAPRGGKSVARWIDRMTWFRAQLRACGFRADDVAPHPGEPAARAGVSKGEARTGGLMVRDAPQAALLTMRASDPASPAALVRRSTPQACVAKDGRRRVRRKRSTTRFPGSVPAFPVAGAASLRTL